MPRRLILFILSILLIPTPSSAGDSHEISVIPRPVECDVRNGRFFLDQNTVIVLPTKQGDQLNPVIGVIIPRLRTTGWPLEIVSRPVPEDYIDCALDSTLSGLGMEGYILESDRKGIRLRAPAPAGIFYAFQTLIQLLPPAIDNQDQSKVSSWSIPFVTIRDYPRFSWRGMHLDVGRHFFPVEFIRRYIDLLASYKMNIFHWHLTEDQGWRIEIKKYPRLTEIGSKRRETMGDCTPYGGFYTQEEIRSIVEYARQRFITIVPEIEMPGHALAALASYPGYSCSGGPLTVGTEWGVVNDVYCPGKEETFSFLQDIIGEVAELFPGPYFHIGGDECPKLRWQNCVHCWIRMQKQGLKDEGELQSYFIKRIEKIVNADGKRLVGWDEILEGGLAPNATVMSWRGIVGGIAAAKAGHDVIMSPTSHCYFDYFQGVDGEPRTVGGFLPIDTVYSFEPVPSDLTAGEAKHIIGAQGNVWTEWIPTTQQVEYMVLPRLCAMSEVTWTQRSGRNFTGFMNRLSQHYDRFLFRGLNFRVPTPAGFGGKTVIFSDTLVKLPAPVDGAAVYWTSDGQDPTIESQRYTNPVPVHGDAILKAMVVLPGGKQSSVVTGSYFRVNRSRNGLSYLFYRGEWEKLPDFTKLKHVSSGKVYDISLTQFEHEKENYAVRFRGMIEIPGDGDYVFSLSSDDGSALLCDGTTVVDNDGLHGRIEVSGTIHLSRGDHPFEVRYFQRGGGSNLDVGIEGPGMTKQPLPPSMLKPAAN